MFIRVKPSGPRKYLQIVKSIWDKGTVRQKVIGTLGRLDKLKESGELDGLLRSGVRFSEKLAIIDSYEKGHVPSTEDVRVGIPIIFDRLWKELGIRPVIEEGIFQRSRDLFRDLTLVFFDTTSIYFEGNGGDELGAFGHSKDHRPDLKQMVEQIFRSLKTILSTRPIYHKCDETIRGHVFCSFLSLLLIKELQGRMDQKGWQVEWADLMNDLEEVKEIRIQTDNKEVFLRSELRGNAGKAFQAAGAAIPPTVRVIGMDDKDAVKLR